MGKKTDKLQTLCDRLFGTGLNVYDELSKIGVAIMYFGLGYLTANFINDSSFNNFGFVTFMIGLMIHSTAFNKNLTKKKV